MSANDSTHLGPTSFGCTRWTLVLRAKGGSAPEAPGKDEARRAALGELISLYWKPLYCYLRRKGRAAEDAQDLTQAFFTAFLEKDFLKSVDREKGRFRRFLLVALEHFLANEYDRQQAQKRGGGKVPLRLDFDDAEKRYTLEPVSNDTPEKVYARKWARELSDRAMQALAADFEQKGKREVFLALQPHLGGGEDYAGVAGALNMTVSNVKVTVHRLRQRYRELLRDAVRDTVQSDAEVDAELYELINAL